MEIISQIGDMLERFDVQPYIAFAIMITLICLHSLIQEYGKTWVAHLLHRRNLPHVCGVFLFIVAFLLLNHLKLWKGIPIWLQCSLILLFFAYALVVLFSVRGPVLFSAAYLKRYKRYLYEGSALEHSEIIEKMPWYFQDADEKIAYQTLRAKFLFERGNYIASYQALEEIDAKLLYPEELGENCHSRVILLLELGNLPKAKQIVQEIEQFDAPIYHALCSYLEELQGNPAESYEQAYLSESAITPQYRDYGSLSFIYTQLGRVNAFQGNDSEMFRYYRKAIEMAKKGEDARRNHAVYQNMLGQMLMRRAHMEEYEAVLSEYISIMADSSLNNQVQLENTLIELARQAEDRDREYAVIKEGYSKLRQMADEQGKYLVEISTLHMLTVGGFPIDMVLEDVKSHFDLYLQLPMPARMKAVMDFVLPDPPSPGMEPFYEHCSKKLSEYGEKQAFEDLKSYEKGLSTDSVNERCWVILQQIELLHRQQNSYDGEEVLRLMSDMIQIYGRSGQVRKIVEMYVMILNEYDHLIFLGQKQADRCTLNEMRRIVKKASDESKKLPSLTIAPLLIDIAHFSAKLHLLEEERDAFNRFRSTRISPRQYSPEMEEKVEMLRNHLRT